jgi:hypothetical protein
MSVDRFYAEVDGRWKKLGEAELSDVRTDYWVDICHGGNVMVDERYYFSSLASALEFYLEGWNERQFVDADNAPCGLDHSGLYSSGRPIHGQSVHGDIPGHEGEGLREILDEIEKALGEAEEL